MAAAQAAQGVPKWPLGLVVQGDHAVGGAAPVVRLDVFIDWVCPFSKKAFNTLVELLSDERAADIPVSVAFQMCPQPFHPGSPPCHEVYCGIEDMTADSFGPDLTTVEVSGKRLKVSNPVAFKFACRLMEEQDLMKDKPVWEKTRPEMYEILAGIARRALAKDEFDESKYSEMVALNPQGLNGGNNCIPRFKEYTRQHRQLSVNVTPTVRTNGVTAAETESAWTVDRWLAYLAPWKVSAPPAPKVEEGGACEWRPRS